MTSNPVPFELTDSLGRYWIYYPVGILRCQIDKSKIAIYKAFDSNGLSVFLTDKDKLISATFMDMNSVLNTIISASEFKFADFHDHLGRLWYCTWTPDDAVTINCLPYGPAAWNKIIPHPSVTVELDKIGPSSSYSTVATRIIIKNMAEFLTAFLAYKTAIEDEDDI